MYVLHAADLKFLRLGFSLTLMLNMHAYKKISFIVRFMFVKRSNSQCKYIIRCFDNKNVVFMLLSSAGQTKPQPGGQQGQVAAPSGGREG
jgi:hypothetical protein